MEGKGGCRPTPEKKGRRQAAAFRGRKGRKLEERKNKVQPVQRGGKAKLTQSWTCGGPMRQTARENR